MEKYQLTSKAEDDIEKIYEYSILKWGLVTARDYFLGLHEKFGLLADNQSWGNDYDFISPGLYRYEYRSHSIYYRSSGDLILIVRILGNRQDPARHF